MKHLNLALVIETDKVFPNVTEGFWNGGNSHADKNKFVWLDNSPGIQIFY